MTVTVTSFPRDSVDNVNLDLVFSLELELEEEGAEKAKKTGHWHCTNQLFVSACSAVDIVPHSLYTMWCV